MSRLSHWILCVSWLVMLGDIYGEVCRKSPCEYTFNIRHDRTMIYRPKEEPGKAYKVGLNGSRLKLIETTFIKQPNQQIGKFVDDLDDVITADGVSRNIITINGKFPGPTIEVEEGVQLVVKVVNWLLTDVITIHWHGMFHKGEVWMDGMSLVTQCPIPFYQPFTYRFEANPTGTHWYHTHNGLQRIDGLFGMLIVHPKKVPPPRSFTLVVADWIHEDSITIETTNPYSQERGDKGAGEHLHTHKSVREYGPDGVENSGTSYQSGLINGRGRYGGNKIPLTRFKVTHGLRYRFRTLNAGAEFLLAVSIDGHVLTAVAMDGADIVPYNVDAVVLAPGETLDFEIEATQPIGLYWMRARTLHDGNIANVDREILAVIEYIGTPLRDDPTSLPRKCTSGNLCKTLNCPFENYPASYQRQCVSVAKMRSRDYQPAAYGLMRRDVDMELFLNVGFAWGSSINGRKNLNPSAPLYMKNRRFVDCDELCKDLTMGCVCSANFTIPVGKIIQMVISNLQYDEPLVAHHPMHLHGHNFAILKIGYGTYDPSGRYVNHTRDVVCDNKLCREPKWNKSVNINLNLNNPPLKNTIVVPARGYVVVRFKADNPGRWQFHCHAITHNMEGMTALFVEGEDELLPPVPKDFPTCYGFDWSAEQYEDYMKRDPKSKTGDKGDTDKSTETYEDSVHDDRQDSKERKDREPAREKNVFGAASRIQLSKYELVALSVGCVVIGAFLSALLFFMLCCSRRLLNKSSKVHIMQ